MLVEPQGDWGDGHVELVEIPTTSELVDNIVAFWVPDAPLKPGKSLSLNYGLHWSGNDATRPPGGRTVATRRDHGTVAGGYRFVIDFDGKKLDSLPEDTVLRGVVTIASGDDTAELLDQQVVKNPVTGGWRLTFQIRPLKSDPVELRAYLRSDKAALTETWSYAILK